MKEAWREGQQMPEQAGYSPHPIAAEATHAEADLPNVPPDVSSIVEKKQSTRGRGYSEIRPIWKIPLL